MMSRTMRPRPPWIVAGLVALALVAAGVIALGRHDKAAATTPRTATVGRADVSATVSAAGTVSAVRARTLSFGASGTVASLKVTPGDTVVKGAVLARLDTADAAAAVDAARDNVDAAADALDTAEDAAAAAAAPTSGNATSSRGGGATAGGSGSARAAADAVFSAQQRRNNAKLTLTTAERTLAGTTVRAPAAGRILSVAGAVGGEVAAGGAFIVLAGRADIAVTASFSEAAVVKLALGQATAVTLADRGEPVPGRVSQVDPVGTVSSRLVTYGAQITFDTPPTDLLVGQSATVTVTTARVAGVLAVPSAAVSGISGARGSVTVRTTGGDAEVRTVGVGLLGDRYTEITSGLADGEVVVLPGA